MTALGFGIDIGGTGTKGAIVDLDTGQLAGERLRVDTPQPATPDAIADVVADIIETFDWAGPIGIAVPCVVKHGVAQTAANIDPAWIGVDADELFAKRLNRDADDISILNDADAAGIAEVRFGDERARKGVVLLLTFGTGIGSALFIDGRLVPNTELGHLEVDGHDAEDRAAASAKEHEGLSYPDWAGRVSHYLATLEKALWPDLVIVGGGVSKKADKWVPLLRARSTITVATLKNHAGIVGAAAASAEGIEH
ncbi:MAG: polyphosphate--glucose phosphotransferase [Haloechinothrix sp.]